MLFSHVVSICLAGAAVVAGADTSSSDFSTCNKADVALVKSNTQSQTNFCQTWLEGKRRKSPIQGLTPSELSAACNCISASSEAMKSALQMPVVRVAKTTAKPVIKTTPKTSPKTTVQVIKTTPKVVQTTAKVSIKTTSSTSSRKISSSTSANKVASVVKSSSTTLKSSSNTSKSSIKTIPTASSAKVSSKSSSSSSAASSIKPCIGVACSKLTARTSSTTGKSSSIIKSSTKSPGVTASASGSKVSSGASLSRSSSKVSSSISTSRSGSKVSSSIGKSSSSKSSSFKIPKPSSNPTSDDSGATGGDDSTSGSGSDSENVGTTPTSDEGSAATTSTGDDGAAPNSPAEDDGSAATTSSSSTSTSTVSSPTSSKTTSTKSTSVVAPVTIKSTPKVVSQATTSATSSSSTPASSSPVVRPRPVCNSPLGSNELFQLYIDGTGSAIDGTPMQGLSNGATALGFSVGYSALNFTLDCKTGYVYWGSSSVLSGNNQAFSVKSSSAVVAPIGDSNNSPLSCSMDNTFMLTCQYTSSRSPDLFQSWAVSSGDARYLAMSQSNTTGITLKAVPLKSNSAVTYPTHATNQKLLSNGDFAASSSSPWSKFTQGKSSDVSFDTPAVNASQSCYAFAGMLSIKPNSNFINGYAWGGMAQPGVTLYMGENLFLGYDMFLNYPTGLPSGVRCDVQVKATEHDILSYVRYDSSSPAFVSFNTTTTASYNGTGSFSITAYCQGQPGGPWPTLNLGFNNVRLLAAYDSTDVGAALTCGYKQARDTIQSATLQPYCSSLLSYSTPTTTITSVISTATTTTVTVTSAGKKRSILTNVPINRRQVLPDSADLSSSSSSSAGIDPTISPFSSSTAPPSLGSSPSAGSFATLDSVPSNTSMVATNTMTGLPSALVTFAPADITNACSAEATAVSETVSITTSVTTTITSTVTTTQVTKCKSSPLVNADFESGDYTGWYTYDPVGGRAGHWTVESASGPSGGNYVAQVGALNPGDVGGFLGFANQRVNTCTGVTYTFSFSYRCLTKSYAQAAIAVWTDSGNSYGGDADCSAGDSSWKTLSMTYVSQGGSVQPTLEIVQNDINQGIIQFDNVQWTFADACDADGSLQNTGFTDGLTNWTPDFQSGTVTLKDNAVELYCNARTTGPYDRSGITQYVPTCPGTKYTVTWSYYIAAINGNTDTYIYMYTGDGIISGVSSGYNGESIDGNGNPVGAWYTQTTTFTAKEKSTFIAVQAICCNYDEFTILIDDIRSSVAS